ncbi:MAG: RluA family pseudouridine synthase [Eubacteriales bacterium]|nr:RluA family pseudouridine synthase [Eubacteriales bacterium]
MYLKFIVKEISDPVPLKNYLKTHQHFSSRLIKRLRLYGQVEVNGESWRMIDLVKLGDQIEIKDANELEDSCLKLKKSAYEYLVFENDYYLLVNKPAGLLSHPNYLGGTNSLEQLLSDQPLHLVSRLDRGTSGLLLISRHAHAHQRLQNTEMKKYYLLWVFGRLPETTLRLEAKIARRPGSIIEREVNEDSGKLAISHFRELFYSPSLDISLLSCRIETGRTHQIRVHALHLGLPLIGETLYGLERLQELNPTMYQNCLKKQGLGMRQALNDKYPQQVLHAYHLAFHDPFSGKAEKFFAQEPSYFFDMLSMDEKSAASAALRVFSEQLLQD